MVVNQNDQNVPINVPISSGLEDVLNLLKENNAATALEISSKLAVSEKTIKRRIKELKDMNIIERIGSNKTGFWKIRG